MNKRPALPETIFESRGSKTHWPTLRSAFLTQENLPKIERLSTGVIFLSGEYNARLNQYTSKDPTELAVFFEHGFTLKVKESPHNRKKAYMLSLIGNYYNGAVFHVAFQYPQCLYYYESDLEQQAFRLYWRVAGILYDYDYTDREVKEFIEQGKKRKTA